MQIGDQITVSYEDSKRLRKEGWRPCNDVVVMQYVGKPEKRDDRLVLPGKKLERPKYKRIKLDKRCTMPGCSSPHHGLGYCYIHYRRFRRHGDHRFVCLPGKRPRGPCDEPNCGRLSVARGLCNMHYLRMRKEQKVFECREAA